MTIGKAYREIQRKKREAQAKIDQERKQHPLVARPVKKDSGETSHHKIRSKHDSIMTKVIGYEEGHQNLMKNVSPSIIETINDIKIKKKPKKGGNDHVIIHGKDDSEDKEKSNKIDSDAYTDHSTKYE